MVVKAEKKKIKLEVQKREIFGRKIKKLRHEGILPANIYGKKITSQSLQLDLKKFLLAYQQAGETSVVELQLKGDSGLRPVLIHNVQLDPVTDQPLHVDFFQVSLKEKVTATIPIEIVGEAPVVKEKGGILIQPLLEIEVEALPTDLPDKFEVDISQLKEINDSVAVSDLKTSKEVKIITGSQQIVAKIEPPAKEEEVAPKEEKVEEETLEETAAGEEGQTKETKGIEKEKTEGKPEKTETSKKD